MAQSTPLDELTLGVTFMDSSHRALADQLELLPLATERNFCEIYCELVRLLECDFYNEEAWMEKIVYPEFKEHLEQHSRLLGVLHRAMPKVMEGDHTLGRQVTAQLSDWFHTHLTTMDGPLAASLLAAGLSTDTPLS